MGLAATWRNLRDWLCLRMALWIFLTGVCAGHPLSHGTLAVVVHPDRVEVRARVTTEEAVITGMLAGPPELDEASRPGWHAQYLVEHLELVIDGERWGGRVRAVLPSGQQSPDASVPDSEEHAVYELVFAPSDVVPGRALPQQLRLRQDVLAGVELAPGIAWEASYTVSIRTARSASIDGLLLPSDAPLVHVCRWEAPNSETEPLSTSAVPAHGTLFRQYLGLGFHHILVGYDHLLFICALVLAVQGLWELVKIVTAFTLAHTLTLTLAALGWAQLPAGLVEPMIALSIVIAAAQNLLWPEQSRGWSRLAVAAGFGLFHGLGFAGGLLEAMQALPGTTILVALAAFSIGVELGHQLIVIPVFIGLRIASRSRSSAQRPPPLLRSVQRWGSWVIGLAGLYYLAAALKATMALAAD